MILPVGSGSAQLALETAHRYAEDALDALRRRGEDDTEARIRRDDLVAILADRDRETEEDGISW